MLVEVMESRVEGVEKEVMEVKTLLAEIKLQNDAALARMREENQKMREENVENYSKLMMCLSKGKTHSVHEEGEHSVVNTERDREFRTRTSISELQGDELLEFRQSMKKVEFPMFFRDDPTGWITRAEIYFDVQETSDAVRVKLAQLCMDGGTIHFFNAWANEAERRTWETFKVAVLERYGGASAGNVYEQLQSLQQIDEVDGYIQEFEYLVGQIPKLPDEQYFSYFISGLKEEIKGRIRSYQSMGTISRGRLMNLARAVETELRVKNRAHGGQGRTEMRTGSGSSWSGRPNSMSFMTRNISGAGGAANKESRMGGVSSGPLSPRNDQPKNARNGPKDRGIKHLSYQELMECKQRGLCYKCGEKYHPQHLCLERALQIMLVEEDEVVEGVERVESPENDELGEYELIEGECSVLSLNTAGFAQDDGKPHHEGRRRCERHAFASSNR